MKFHFLEATDLNDAWFQALHRVMNEGRWYLITKGSNEGTHRAGIAIVQRIQYPGHKPLHPLMPEGSGLPAPTSQEDIEDYFALYIMSTEKAENEHYTYGEDLQWLHQWVIDHYKKYGHGTNHCYMSVGRPETVYFYDRDIGYEETIKIFNPDTGEIIKERHVGNEWNKNPENKPSSQCLRGIDTWIDEGKLHFWVYFRSWDLWGGYPVNLGGLQLLKKYMADEIGIGDGEMIVSCKDLHIYESTIEIALTRVGIKKNVKEWLGWLLEQKKAVVRG